jgi:two-component system, LuxR family, sensor kinase FixL
VSDTAILAQNNLTEPPRKSSVGQFLFFFGAVMLGGIIVGSMWFYLESNQNLERLTQTNAPHTGAATRPVLDAANARAALHEAQSWVRQLSTATTFGAAGIFVVTLIVALWSRHRAHRLVIQAQAAYETAATENDALRNERDRLERELKQFTQNFDKQVEERTNRLAASHAQIQKELDDRRRAERVMTQQAKELERSKDVLELHVQSRTQELQKLQRRNESILNSAGEGIYGLDLYGRTTFVNPAAAKITGWKVEELVGKSESEVFHCPVSGEAPAENQGEGEEGDHKIFYRKDGSSFPAEYVRTPIKEKDRDIGAVVIFKDITERKRAEEAINRKAAELSRSNAELEQFAYVASHDLQEPLRKIQAFGDRLKAKCDAVNLQEGRDYLERMQSAAARMQTLINDLLTFSRVISASQPFVPVDLNAVTKGVLSDLEVRIEQTKARVEVGELPFIEGDPLQMRQLLQNLIGNALKFQPPNAQPLIRIAGRILKSPFAGTPEEDPYAEQCELTIHDNGIGFDERYLDKIFAVFQRLHGRNEYEGTGVGLAVCRRITDRHGGTINAKSKPGEGATFIVTLPVRHPKKELAP